MELLVMAISWWLVGFTGAMMPGPVTTLVVTETAKRGFIAGPLITIGHVLLELAMVVALFFGLGDLLKQNFVAGAIGILGGLFLLWMGFDIVRSAWLGKVSLNTAQQDQKPVFSQTSIKSNRKNPENGFLRQSSTNPIVAGILTSIANPYWILWWATVGAASLVSFRAFGIPGLIAFYVGHTMADWVWNNFVAFIVATGRRVINDRIYRGILIVCGAFLIGLSFYFLSSGVGFLRG